MGKTRNIIFRPASRMYPIELYEKKENQNEQNIDENSSRTRREAAITADIKRKIHEYEKYFWADDMSIEGTWKCTAWYS